MSAERDYWSECIAVAAEDCGLKLTNEQLECLAGAAEGCHENYGTAFYSPPSSDRIDALQRQHEERMAEQRREMDAERQRAKQLDEDRLWTIRRQRRRIEELQEEAREHQ